MPRAARLADSYYPVLPRQTGRRHLSGELSPAPSAGNRVAYNQGNFTDAEYRVHSGPNLVASVRSSAGANNLEPR
jgi:hypothetical protein